MPKWKAKQTTGRTPARPETTTTTHSALTKARTGVEDHWTGSELPGYPKGISPTLLLQYEERWVRGEQYPAWSEIMGKILLACAIYRSHNPILLSWRTGFPTAVTSTLVECLLSEEEWLDEENYPRLVRDVRCIQDDDLVDRTVVEVLEVLSAASLRRFAAVWEQMMDRPVEQ